MPPQLTWINIASTLIGGAICIPTLMVGYLLGQSLSLSHAVIAICIGNMALLFMGLRVADLTAQNRKNAAELFNKILGKESGRAIGLLLFTLLAVWVGIQTQTMAAAITCHIAEHLGQSSHMARINKTVCILMTFLILLSSRKLESISSLCSWSIPFMIALMVIPLMIKNDLVVDHPDLTLFDERVSPALIQGISIVIASSIAAVIDLPTFLKQCRTAKDMKKVVIVLFGGGTALMEIFGVLLSRKGGASLIESLTIHAENISGSLEASAIYLTPVNAVVTSALLILAGWTTNATNIFSMEQIFKTIFDNSLLTVKKERYSLIAVGAISVLTSMIELIQELSLVLSLLATPLIAMVGVSVSLGKKKELESDMAPSIYPAVIIGSIVGVYEAGRGHSIFFEPMIDTFLAAFITTQFLCKKGMKNYAH